MKALVGISLIGIGLIFSKIDPGSISDFNTTKKNSMWLAGFRRKDKTIVIQDFASIKEDFASIKDVTKKGHIRKIIQFSEAKVASNFDITLTSIHVQRLTGYFYNWSILNDWPIQKKWLTHTKMGESWQHCITILNSCGPNLWKCKTCGKSLVLCAYLRNI